ncbi:MAG TPA: arginine--tRNA ligase [Candidatus Saccharimonadales bacterium]|nr:arginine--tRNA ligase [Candidatus Saccharimonadales bacterium]
MEKLREILKQTVKDLFDIDVEPELTRPEEQFGDYSTNVAMQLGPKLGKPPREVAEALANKIQDTPMVAKTEVAGPGFINFFVSDKALLDGLARQPAKTYESQTIVVEYSDPNPFKVLHVGHLYTSIVGDAIANLFEVAGAKVARVNFGGDVGLHVAKTMWSVLQKLGGESPEKLQDIEPGKRSEWLTDCYVEGNNEYEQSANAKTQIVELNKRIYQITEQQDKSSALAQIYWTIRQWSYDYFSTFYKRIGSHFDRFYPESEAVEPGLKTVRENIGKVFEESEGAVVFKGEVHNMHTRVFINSEGLPTYETKDIGLILKKWQDYRFDRSIIITGNDIYEYMQVVLKAIEQIAPELAQKTTHITHGLVKPTGGVKMSSRLGNIIRAEDVLAAASEANKQANRQENFDVALGAVKYAFLKNRIGADFIFDPAESVSLQGNSGPYLQYAYVRAKSILSKAQDVDSRQKTVDRLEADERSLTRKIGEFAEVVEQATSDLLPSHICTYLYELAQNFNRFYEKNRILGDEREALRLKLVDAYAKVLKNGLQLLNIATPEKM